MIKNHKGFTLIETTIYIALFALLMGMALMSAYYLIDSSKNLGTKTNIQEEGNFIIRKLNWTLTGVVKIITPETGTTDNLKITKYDGKNISICLDAQKILISKNSDGECSIENTNYLPLSTDNIEVTNLSFELISVGGTKGITATVILTKNETDFPFTITKYVR